MAIWNRSKSKKNGSASKAESPSRDPELFRLGKTMRLKGDLLGDVDVEIHGVVEGKVVVSDHSVVVADGGRAMADVTARQVVVRGHVVGNVSATERIVVQASGTVMGDICAPSVQLDDGSRFTGSINREAAPAKVSGQLGSDGPVPTKRPVLEKSVALVRRRPVPDRRGGDRPWGADSNRRTQSREPEPSSPS